MAKKQENIKENKGCFQTFKFVFLFGWALIFILFLDLYQTNTLKSWTPIEAILENVEIETYRVRRGSSRRIKLTYQYKIEGATYKGNSIARNPFHRNKIKKTKKNIYPIFDKLDYAKKIQVYYNPKNHEESVVINQLTNSWFSFMWFVLFINSLIYGLKLAIERKNKSYLLLPVIVFLLIIYQSLIAKIQYIDTAAMIIVTEKYDPGHCKFALRSFESDVYSFVHNIRMENEHELFHRKTVIKNLKIKDTLNDTNKIFRSIAEVIYNHEGIDRTISFNIEYEISEDCRFTRKKMEEIKE